jgi:prepilin-type N-terminal cleavage/methylation domain-containing protein
MIAVHRDDDRGVTLVEVMVSMSVFSVLMAIFTTGVLQMFKSNDKDMDIAQTVSQANQAFVRLDKQIRYASAISTPTNPPLASGSYVEYLISVVNLGTCYELWYDPAQHALRSRNWPAKGVAGNTWSTLATGVTATTPFTLIAPVNQFTFQRLKLNLTTSVGAQKSATTAQTSVTFTALNTTVSTTNPPACTDDRPAS